MKGSSKNSPLDLSPLGEIRARCEKKRIFITAMKEFKSCYCNMFLAVFFCSLFFACVPQKKIVYFQDKSSENKDTTHYSVPQKPDMKIYKKDILTVVVYTENPEALPGIGSSIDTKVVDNRPSYEKGFTVDDAGDLTLPLVGNVHAAGLTVDQVKQAIVQKYKVYIANPVVVVKKLSFKVSVLGEVTHPDIYYVNNESITLLEALSMAGDLTKYGSRTDVKVIRSINGKQEEFMVDLTDKNVLYSPLFYLMQDDVIYVRQLKSKRWADISPQVSIITSVISVTVAVATLLIVTSQK
ncbi:MAG: polysaccharide biosynthesis/export family protein [Bacteroidia bacterium]